MRFAEILRPYAPGIAGALGLGLVQQLAWIAEPFVFGRAIDALIEHQQHDRVGKLVLHLSLWLGVFGVNSLAGALQRPYAERVHGALYRDVCATLARLGAERAEPPPRTAARAELFRDLVAFLDDRAPTLVAAVVNLAGAVIALAYFDARIALVCLGFGIPIAIAQRVVDTRIAHLQRAEHDLRERDVDVFATGATENVAAHFEGVREVRVRAAQWGSLNFGLLRGFLIAIFVAVLYIALDLDAFTTGAVYSIVSYLWTFIAYAEDVPTLLESRTSLRDLARRVETEARIS